MLVKMLLTELVLLFTFAIILSATDDDSKGETVFGFLTTMAFLALVVTIVAYIWS